MALIVKSGGAECRTGAPHDDDDKSSSDDPGSDDPGSDDEEHDETQVKLRKQVASGNAGAATACQLIAKLLGEDYIVQGGHQARH